STLRCWPACPAVSSSCASTSSACSPTARATSTRWRRRRRRRTCRTTARRRPCQDGRRTSASPTRCPKNAMSDLRTKLFAWLHERGTGELEATVLLDGLASLLMDAGLDLHRVSVWIPTKHPELWGNQIVWEPMKGARV